MSRKKNNYTDKQKVGDMPISCMQCGMPCWQSESTKLNKNTGKGGLIVCPVCIDKTDYGLIPYKVGAETSPKNAFNDQQSTLTLSTIPDFTIFDPLSGKLP